MSLPWFSLSPSLFLVPVPVFLSFHRSDYRVASIWILHFKSGPTLPGIPQFPRRAQVRSGTNIENANRSTKYRIGTSTIYRGRRAIYDNHPIFDRVFSDRLRLGGNSADARESHNEKGTDIVS